MPGGAHEAPQRSFLCNGREKVGSLDKTGEDKSPPPPDLSVLKGGLGPRL